MTRRRVVKEDGRWHLDKRVPIAIVIGLVMQTGAALVWAGSAGQRLHELEESFDAVRSTAERTTRLEEQVSYIRASLDRIERKLDARLEEKR